MIEHVIVEPMRAHRFVPVTTDIGYSAVTVGRPGPRVGGAGIDAIIARQDHRPVVVVELPGERERMGEAVALGRVVAVVFVRSDGVRTEAEVRGGIDRQRVVVAE